MTLALLVSILFTTVSPEIIKLPPIERLRACKELKGLQDVKHRLLEPYSANLGLRVREYLELKKAKVPPPSGWFSEPKVYISIIQKRKQKRKKLTSLDVLLSIDAPKDPQLFKAVGEALIRGCIIKRLANNPQAGVATLLLDAAFHPLVFVHRELITHTLESMGPIIVPELLPWTRKKFRKDRNRLGYLKVKYASYILRISPSGTPRLALQSAPKDLKLQLIDLYGKFRLDTAIKPLLKLANSDDPEIRQHARAAILSYFDGPRITKGSVGTIRLPGGVETTAILYYSSRQQAYHAVRKKLEEATRGDFDRTLKGKKLAQALFKTWDKIKKKKWELLFSKVYREFLQTKDLKATSESYLKVLAHEPQLPQRHLMKPVFLELARNHLKLKDLQNAIKFTRLAMMVSLDRTLKSDLYYLMGLMHEKDGNKIQAVHWYRRALDINSSHPHAFAALWNVSPIPHVHEKRFEYSILLLSIILGFIVFSLIIIRRYA